VVVVFVGEGGKGDASRSTTSNDKNEMKDCSWGGGCARTEKGSLQIENASFPEVRCGS
jgi:hypothetical protein